MATTPEAIIAELLLTHLKQLPAQTPPVDFSPPGFHFDPTPGKTYLEARFLPNTNVNYGIGSEGPTQHIGLLQVTVCYPSGRGEIAAQEVAGAVIAHFAKGTKLWSGAVGVKVYQKPSVAPSLEGGDRIRVPVAIPYSATNLTPA